MAIDPSAQQPHHHQWLTSLSALRGEWIVECSKRTVARIETLRLGDSHKPFPVFPLEANIEGGFNLSQEAQMKKCLRTLVTKKKC